MVLVHDDDLKCAEGAIPPLETLQPDALMGFFRGYAPTIRQFQCGKYFAEQYGPRSDRVYTKKMKLVPETRVSQELRWRLLP